jgi:hypothetical protein
VTIAPWFGVKSTRPSACSRRSASRTGVRLTPAAAATSCSVIRVDGRYRPPMIPSLTAW